jgi:hypothetical protein
MTIKDLESQIRDFKGDKRSKEYKHLKESLKALKSSKKSLGDVVEGITKATGIKKAVEVISEALDIDCGCDERKDKLNNLFKKKVAECITHDEYLYLHDYFNSNTSRVTSNQQKEMLAIYNRVFNRNKQLTSCSTCFKSVIGDLTKLYKNY